MSDLPELPAGQAAEIEFIAPDKPNQRGIIPGHLDLERPGFWMFELKIPESLAFGDAFRVELCQKWLNRETIAEVRFLDREALLGEVARLRALHEEVRSRLGER